MQRQVAWCCPISFHPVIYTHIDESIHCDVSMIDTLSSFSFARFSTVDVEGCLAWWLGPGKMGSNGYFTDNIVAVHAMRRCL